MAGITMDQMVMLQKTTRENRPSGELVFTQDLQRYPIMNQWFGGADAKRKRLRGGTHLEETIRLKDTDRSRHVKELERREYSHEGELNTIQLDYVRAEGEYMVSLSEMDAHIAQFQQQGGEGVVDLFDAKSIDAKMDMADDLENRVWQLPDAHRNARYPAGIPYYIVMGPADQAGFLGGNPDVGSGNECAGINSDNYDRWKNFSAGGDGYYEYESGADRPTIDDDMIDAMALLHAKTEFIAPLTVDAYVQGPTLQEQSVYLDTDTMLAISSYLRRNRDAERGSGELAWSDGGVPVFKRRPLQVVPALDDRTFTTDGGNGETAKHPIYFIDHGHFYVVIDADREFHEFNTITPSEYPDLMIVLSMVKYNFMCKDRRRQGVLFATEASS